MASLRLRLLFLQRPTKWWCSYSSPMLSTLPTAYVVSAATTCSRPEKPPRVVACVDGHRPARVHIYESDVPVQQLPCQRVRQLTYATYITCYPRPSRTLETGLVTTHQYSIVYDARVSPTPEGS
ncbi:hypothetical protein SODALDRAFT_182054 [Sodiomyces alkalinus F11]|uniref:Uncharacterized protein n=1 Tax=Sodiomyces alkalinus (strain CBS 110278 / VKM F-3762 / F11) TaxID=1314773 RepID=A0A3N2PUD7_SODAK|nr:hypothetical protein SODALDRAFT_182054 [Sodiomyces alkalinus F11]ROT38110.1 hypothetical protein SODALDRAFT_182054 [Sodiomyces alkalinus F11]